MLHLLELLQCSEVFLSSEPKSNFANVVLKVLSSIILKVSQLIRLGIPNFFRYRLHILHCLKLGS